MKSLALVGRIDEETVGQGHGLGHGRMLLEVVAAADGLRSQGSAQGQHREEESGCCTHVFRL